MAKLFPIRSKSNRYIKEARLLKNKKERDEKGLFLIEGLRLAKEALASGEKIRYAFVSERMVEDERGREFLEELKDHCVLFLVEENLIDHVSDTEHSQGVVMVAEKRQYGKEVLKDGSFYIIADRIRDPGNLGTLARTGLAVGVDGLILLPGTVDYYNPKVVRAAMGAIFYLPAYTAGSREEVYQSLREEGIAIVTAEAAGRTPYYDAYLGLPLAFVFGSESEGVDPFWTAVATDTVYLPMNEKSESLNVSISAGVLLYEAARQRKKI